MLNVPHVLKQTPPTYLVPLDGSHLAESVLPAVEALALRCHAQVLLLHVLEARAPAAVHGERHLADDVEATNYLDEISARLRARGLSVQCHVHTEREADVARSIAAHAAEWNADLVILCTHGRGGLRDFLLGSIAQQVLQHGALSILLVRPEPGGSAPPFIVQQILIPLDGTPAHEPAVPVAITIARLFSAPIHLVLVIPTLTTLSAEQALSGRLLPTTTRALLDLAAQDAELYLTQVKARCERENVPATTEILRGEVAEEVLTRAQSLDNCLIVMGSHGRAGLRGLLAGSIAKRITDKAHSSLLLVRLRDAGADRPSETV
jgi:nucleotide-binding universal stress UspA family protein